MDIDDILREADPDFDAGPRGNRDLQALTRAWVAERSAPELLEYVYLISHTHTCDTPGRGAR
jgi:GINS complex subunit 4